MISKYGYDNAFIMLGVGVCLLILSLTFTNLLLTLLSAIPGVLLIVFTLWFFRDSGRPMSADVALDPALVVAPADGKVVEICESGDLPLIQSEGIQISIFLSPLDLHVNRYPVSGQVVHCEYIPGKYLMAFEPKSSTENERSVFVVETGRARVLFRQITGFLARRIVYDTKLGDVVRKGDRFGMMKFGSRMDIVVPIDSDVRVHVGQRVTSNATVLARLRST